MNAPRMELSELVARVDLPALVDRYAGQGRHSGAGWLYSCPSPDHPDRHPSFSVRQDRQGKWWWRCHSQCGTGGDALDLLEWLEHIPTAEAARRLRDFLGMPDDYTSPLPRKNHTPPPPPEPVVDTSTTAPPEVAARILTDYLRARSWPAEVVELFGLEVVLDDMGRPRIRHPFYAPTPAGPTVEWWQDRAWPKGEPKWKAPTGAGHRILHNLCALEDDDLRGVVICEGPADTITATLALTELGADHRLCAVGVPGGTWQSEWADYFTDLEVVVATDADSTGENLAQKVAADLAGIAYRVTRWRPREANDLTDYCRTHGRQALAEFLGTTLVDRSGLFS